MVNGESILLLEENKLQLQQNIHAANINIVHSIWQAIMVSQ